MENRFELQSTHRDWVEFERKPDSGKRRVTQNTACNGNICIEVNKLSTESFKFEYNNNEIISSEQKERLLHGREWTSSIPVILTV